MKGDCFVESGLHDFAESPLHDRAQPIDCGPGGYIVGRVARKYRFDGQLFAIENYGLSFFNNYQNGRYWGDRSPGTACCPTDGFHYYGAAKARVWDVQFTLRCYVDALETADWFYPVRDAWPIAPPTAIGFLTAREDYFRYPTATVIYGNDNNTTEKKLSDVYPDSGMPVPNWSFTPGDIRAGAVHVRHMAFKGYTPYCFPQHAMVEMYYERLFSGNGFRGLTAGQLVLEWEAIFRRITIIFPKLISANATGRVNPTHIEYNIAHPNPAKMTVNFSDASFSPNGIASTLIDFGDGTSSTLSPTSHDYSYGTYAARVTATDGVGERATSPAVNVTANAVAEFFVASMTNLGGGLGVQVTFFNASAPSGLAFKWSFGNGLTSTAANPVVVYLTSGIRYTVSLEVTGPRGDKHTTSKSILVF